MSDIISLTHLLGAVGGLKHQIEATKLSVNSHSYDNKCNLSEYHSRLNELIHKYSGFAEEYVSELNEFHQSLLHKIESIHKEQEAQRRKEKERLEKERLAIEEKTETITHDEIVDNSVNVDYSSAASSKDEEEKEEEPHHSSCDHEEESTEPHPKPVPVALPVVVEPKKAIKSVKKDKTNKKGKKDETMDRKIAETNKNDDNSIAGKYKYNLDRIRWRFHKIRTTTTMIYIGNLPNNIGIAAIQFFVMKKAKVSMRQIEETQLKEGGRGKYALVRFRSDVPLEKVTKFIYDTNEENSKMAEERKKELYSIKTKGAGGKKDQKQKQKEMKKPKKNSKTSWQKKVFMKFNHNFKYYDSEDAMYCDPAAGHKLFIRNFDILNKKCHYELTHKLLEFGDLYDDIDIRIDQWGDPYCIATFKYLNDAIYCCNSEINFNGRTLEMRYAKF